MTEDNQDLQIIPIPSNNAPIRNPVQLVYAKRDYVKRDKIVNLAVKLFDENGRGVTAIILFEAKIASSKARGSRMLKRLKQLGIMFTLVRSRPQIYYPSCKRADIIESLRNRKNVPIDRSVVHRLQNDTLDHRTVMLFDVLKALPNYPLKLHRIQLMLSIRPTSLCEIGCKEPLKGNGQWSFRAEIEDHWVTYTFSPNGTVTIYINASRHPFDIETDEDDSKLFAFLGQVKDRLLNIFGYYHLLEIPTLMDWECIGFDINKDVEITDIVQATGLNLQLRQLDRVFRLYVKSMGDHAVLRVEEELGRTDGSIFSALKSIRRPNEYIEKQLADLTEDMRCLKEEFIYFLQSGSNIHGLANALTSKQDN